MSEEIKAMDLAEGLDKIYADFTESVKSMGSKHGSKFGKSRFGANVLHWIAGSHVKTERDAKCDQFLQDVESQLQTFDYALETASDEEAEDACAVMADIMSRPAPPDSNATTDLMKRAMIGHLGPYLPRLSQDKLREIKDRLEQAYSRSQRLPVEKEILKKIEALLR